MAEVAVRSVKTITITLSEVEAQEYMFALRHTASSFQSQSTRRGWFLQQASDIQRVL